MLLGFLLLGCMPVLVKLAPQRGLHAADVVLWRFLIGCFLVAITVALTRARLRTEQLGMLLLRGVLGAVAVQLYFASIQLAGAGLGTLLNYTYPVWANAIAALVGHRAPRGFWPLLGVAIAGVVLVVDPVFSSVGLGEILGLASAVVAGGAVLTIKKLRETDGELAILLSFSALGALLALPTALVTGFAGRADRLTSDGLAWLLLIGVGVLSYFGQLLFTRGYKDTSIELGTVLSLTVPVVASLTGFLFANETLSVGYFVGGGMILLACALLGRQSSRRERPGVR